VKIITNQKTVNMTREEQLIFCRKCVNRKMDAKQGLLCSLTVEKATFQDECPDFKFDETVKQISPDNKEGLKIAEIKQQLSQESIERLRMEQRLIPGIVSGLIVGIVGAVLWGVITVATGLQIGYLALAIGAGVGLTIRKIGNGIDLIFGIWGAAIALFSVLLGNVLSIIGFIANLEGIGYLEALIRFDYAYLPALMGETFSIMDLVFYGIALFEGYKLSFRLITENKIMELRQMSN
jgi:hypothetical protein